MDINQLVYIQKLEEQDATEVRPAKRIRDILGGDYVSSSLKDGSTVYTAKESGKKFIRKAGAEETDLKPYGDKEESGEPDSSKKPSAKPVEKPSDRTKKKVSDKPKPSQISASEEAIRELFKSEEFKAILDKAIHPEGKKLGQPSLEQARKNVANTITSIISGKPIESKEAIALESILEWNQPKGEWFLAGKKLPEEISSDLNKSIGSKLNVNLTFANNSLMARNLKVEYEALKPAEQKKQLEVYQGKFKKLGIQLSTKAGRLAIPTIGNLDEDLITSLLENKNIPPAWDAEFTKMEEVVVPSPEWKSHEEKVLKNIHDAAAAKYGKDKIGKPFKNRANMEEVLGPLKGSDNLIKAAANEFNSFVGSREVQKKGPPFNLEKMEVIHTGSQRAAVVDRNTGKVLSGNRGSVPMKADVVFKDPKLEEEYRLSIKSQSGQGATLFSAYPDNMDEIIASIAPNSKEFHEFSKSFKKFYKMSNRTPEERKLADELKIAKKEKDAEKISLLKEQISALAKIRTGGKDKVRNEMMYFFHGDVTEQKISFLENLLCCTVQYGILAEGTATHMGIIDPNGGLKIISVRDYAKYLLETPGSFKIDYSSKSGLSLREDKSSKGSKNESEELLFEAERDEDEGILEFNIVGIDNTGDKPKKTINPSLSQFVGKKESEASGKDKITSFDDGKPIEKKTAEEARKEAQDKTAEDKSPRDTEGEPPGDTEGKPSKDIREKLKDKESKLFNPKTNAAYWKEEEQWFQLEDGKELKISDGDLIKFLESQSKNKKNSE
jgi:hypothetical protein